MIQIDMAMPESCAECRFSQGGYMYCHAMPEDFCGYVNYCEEDGKPEWCPLKAQEPKVMTAEDMWALKFNAVVIIEQRIPPLLIPAIVRDNIKHDHCLEVLQVVTASTDRGANADYDYYGKTWRCWTSRPDQATREATPWGD